jgi:hypothetical protein
MADEDDLVDTEVDERIAGMSLAPPVVSTVPVGEEMLSTSCVVAPTMPISSPPASIKVEGAIFGGLPPARAAAGSSANSVFSRMSSVTRLPRSPSPEKSRFAER